MKHIDLSLILNKQEYKYPMLIWSELDTPSRILIATSPKEVKPINTIKEYNLAGLILELERLSSVKDILMAAARGDAATYPIDIVNLSSDLSWQGLLQDFEELCREFSRTPGANPEVNAALKDYYFEDLAASALESVYNSMIYYMITEAQELGISNIMFLGGIIYEEQFANLVNRHLPVEMNAQFADL